MKSVMRTVPSPIIAEDLVSRKEFARGFGCCERTVRRLELMGLPHIRIGARRLYEPVKVRQWMVDHECRLGAPASQHPQKEAA